MIGNQCIPKARGRRNGCRRVQSGYVLLIVVATLAVISFVALRFAERIDELRRNARSFTELATARSDASGAAAAALYWMATRPILPTGHGDGALSLKEDGRLYHVDHGAWLSVQDVRGLLSLNALDRQSVINLLVQDGLELERANAYLDVLEDYRDADDLKRLNGAERDDYAQLGLPPPRNDWLLSVRELELMPLWKDDPARVARLSRLLSVVGVASFNPATASVEVLKAVFPLANPNQIELLLTLRKGDQLINAAMASHVTGLLLDREGYWFAPSGEARITAWAPGMPRALEYNARLTPAGEAAPWLITELHSAPRLTPPNEPHAAPAFPLALAPGTVALAASTSAP